MNWFKVFWHNLNAPSNAARRIYQNRPAPKGSSSASAPSSTPKPPPTAFGLLWRSDPREQKDPLANFSPRAQQAIALARKEAERFNHDFVGTEHLLLGIIALGQGVAWDTLTAMGLKLDIVRAEIEKQVGTGSDQKMIGHIPYTPRVKKVLALATKEARALNDTYVGTEHILLGLLREGGGVAARVLKNLDINVEETRAVILKRREILGAETQPSDPVSTETSSSSSALLNPLENFTPRAQQVLEIARQEAAQRKQLFFGTEHVLIGLAELGNGTAATALAKLGLNPETIAAQIDKLDQRPPAEKAREGAYYTQFVSEALRVAAEIARHLNHTYIGTEHILLGLLTETDGGAAQIFKNLNIDSKTVREDIFKELDPNFRPLRKPAMQSNPSKQPREPVDTTKRYDVYCVARNEQASVVYRNVLIKSVKTLFQRHDHDALSDFIELEHTDGQTVFVAKSTVYRLCSPGVNPNSEKL